jgi:hypothetical protein
MALKVNEGFVPIPDPTTLTNEAVAQLRMQVLEILDIRLSAFRELVDEKFKGVSTEFTMRDIALAAAFKAAEAAVTQQNQSNQLASDKSATAFTKQIDNLDEKINNIKEDVGQLRTRNYAAVGGYIVGALGVVLTVISVILHLPRTI